MKNALILIIILFSLEVVHGQSPPYINGAINTTYPGDTIVITGSGFDANPTNLQVWFGHVTGSIVSSSNFSIKVAVPPHAKYNNIEVVNMVTKLSAKADKKFQPYFSGSTFTLAKMVSAASMPNASQLYDVCSCDFNLDGKPDVATTNLESDNVTILLAQ